MTSRGASSPKRASSDARDIGKLKLLATVGVAAILVGLILLPMSKISETERVSTTETQTVAQSLCPPPIVTSLDPGDCQITLVEHSPNLTADARVAVYDQNNSVVYQSSMFQEGEPSLIRLAYDFTVTDSGVYNITIENAGTFIAKIELTTTTWENVATYPFESLFYSGLIVAAVGLGVIWVSLTRALRG